MNIIEVGILLCVVIVLVYLALQPDKNIDE